MHHQYDQKSGHPAIDLQGLLNRVNFQNRWVYKGSFTSPPCSEGVLWQVIDDVQYMKPGTLDLIKQSRFSHDRSDLRCEMCNGNNRKMNPVHDRTIYYLTYGEEHPEHQRYYCDRNRPVG